MFISRGKGNSFAFRSLTCALFWGGEGREGRPLEIEGKVSGTTAVVLHLGSWQPRRPVLAHFVPQRAFKFAWYF